MLIQRCPGMTTMGTISALVTRPKIPRDFAIHGANGSFGTILSSRENNPWWLLAYQPHDYNLLNYCRETIIPLTQCFKH